MSHGEFIHFSDTGVHDVHAGLLQPLDKTLFGLAIHGALDILIVHLLLLQHALGIFGRSAWNFEIITSALISFPVQIIERLATRQNTRDNKNRR
ncbi:hypothetical protein CQ062_19610 [Ochrobactrum sp. MYb68]|nr:hypothetical protein CQ062_19610 [Ochrobactrum sp. MYb68]